MPRFEFNTPIAQAEPDVLVEMAPGSPLPIGAHRFQLVVVDEAGNESAPAFLEVIVRDDQRPTAVLEMNNESGQRIEPVVGFGRNFILSGRRSRDAPPGRIAEFRFTLVDRN